MKRLMADQKIEIAHASAPLDSSLPPVGVLIVDDRKENLLVLEAVLEPLGQRVVRAQSGQAALLAVADEKFAVILMDVRMPGLDGLETMRLLRQQEGRRRVATVSYRCASPP